MHSIFYSNRSKNDLKKLVRNAGFKIENLKFILNALANGEKLDAKYRNHKLQGEFEGFWECHIQYDILLVYGINKENQAIEILRIGSHEDLFK